MSLPRPKKPKEVDVDWTKAATLRPNRKSTATVKRLSVISMSSRIAVSPFQGTAPASGRQAKKVSLPVVPNMIGMDRSKCEDVNRNVRSNLSCRSMASPSRMSDDRSSDSQNCNRVCRPGIFGTHSSSSFSNYGTEVGQLLGTKNGGE
ncbi:unnamed protein product [Nippostrongylus brasiliensis]|uniref:Ovule protein n=1 Tax=Nippostrongylus brasiliensis TaxID=27835 RepID=A0A0N4XWS5_NIPBR|nr:unnamed protein product [Nippostrongylus brasiliensis]